MPRRWPSRYALGIAGASFAVSLPLASRAYSPAAQGLVLGIAASGNIGTVFIFFWAPRWAEQLGWHAVCLVMTLVLVAMSPPAFQCCGAWGS